MGPNKHIYIINFQKELVLFSFYDSNEETNAIDRSQDGNLDAPHE